MVLNERTFVSWWAIVVQVSLFCSFLPLIKYIFLHCHQYKSYMSVVFRLKLNQERDARVHCAVILGLLARMWTALCVLMEQAWCKCHKAYWQPSCIFFYRVSEGIDNPLGNSSGGRQPSAYGTYFSLPLWWVQEIKRMYLVSLTHGLFIT